MCGYQGPCGPMEPDKEAIHWRDSLNGYLTNDLSTLPEMDAVVDSFMNFWSLRGVSMAVMRNDSLLYAHGYGKADATTPMTPGHHAPAGLRLQAPHSHWHHAAAGKGAGVPGHAGFWPVWRSERIRPYIRDDNYYLITVEHLLRHQAGFTSRGGDPVFSPYTSREALLQKQLGRRLAYEPGTTQEYSNLGFLLLSLIIEEVSGKPYEQFMQEEVFSPALCRGFRLAGNYLEDRHPGETRYYMHPEATLTASFDGRYAAVEKCYGGNDVHGSLGAGGWTGSAAELARMVACIDGQGPLEDILVPFSVRQMTDYYDADTFSLGWNDTKPTGEWTRSGSFLRHAGPGENLPRRRVLGIHRQYLHLARLPLRQEHCCAVREPPLPL